MIRRFVGWLVAGGLAACGSDDATTGDPYGASGRDAGTDASSDGGSAGEPAGAGGGGASGGIGGAAATGGAGGGAGAAGSAGGPDGSAGTDAGEDASAGDAGAGGGADGSAGSAGGPGADAGLDASAGQAGAGGGAGSAGSAGVAGVAGSAGAAGAAGSAGAAGAAGSPSDAGSPYPSCTGLPTGMRCAAGTNRTILVAANNDEIGRYAVTDGAYLGDLVGSPNPNTLSIKHAVQGPDHCIYVSDSIDSSIHVYDTDGTFLQTMANAAPAATGAQGLAFHGGVLHVATRTANKVMRFSTAGAFLGDHVDDGSTPYDVEFLADGRMLLSDESQPGASDRIRLYPAGGGTATEVATGIVTPEQISTLTNGNFAVSVFGQGRVVELALSGTVVLSVPLGRSQLPRGIFPLADGRWLVTAVVSSSCTMGCGTEGTKIIDPALGTVLDGRDVNEPRFVSHACLP